MEKLYFMMDVGGTQIKGGILDEYGSIRGELLIQNAHSQESGEVILDNLAELLRKLLHAAGKSEIAGVGMAFPGPFDYENGVSFMRGIGKYEGIYGLSLTEELRSRVPELKKKEFCFLHDIEAFALGECWFGEAERHKKMLCLCIGTGAGTAFLENKKILKEKKDGVPENGWLYDNPYKGSVIDDYLSRRGLEKLGRKILGRAYSGKELYERCLQKDQKALQVYREFGADLKNSLLPFLEEFQPDGVIMGGQISGSFAYFGQDFAEECERRGITVYLEPETSIKAMQGLLTVMR